MTDATKQSAGGGIVQSYMHTAEIVERPAADRPLRDTVDATDWLLGPALQVATGVQAFDEFALRMLAAGFPLARLTVHSGTLHPQFLGTSLRWWRDTAQSVQTYVEHGVVGRPRPGSAECRNDIKRRHIHYSWEAAVAGNRRLGAPYYLDYRNVVQGMSLALLAPLSLGFCQSQLGSDECRLCMTQFAH